MILDAVEQWKHLTFVFRRKITFKGAEKIPTTPNITYGLQFHSARRNRLEIENFFLSFTKK